MVKKFDTFETFKEWAGLLREDKVKTPEAVALDKSIFDFLNVGAYVNMVGTGHIADNIVIRLEDCLVMSTPNPVINDRVNIEFMEMYPTLRRYDLETKINPYEFLESLAEGKE